MKKIMSVIIILILICLIKVEAQTEVSNPSPTLTSSSPQEDKEIEALKEKIATKVAELRQKNGRAVSGLVQEVKTPQKLTSLKIKTWKDEIFEIKVDQDLTQFYQINGEQKKEVRTSSIKKDLNIIVTGIIKDKVVEANSIYIDDLFIVGSGKVTEVNKSDYFVRVVTFEKENYTLDIETTTKQQMLNIKTLAVENVGFSKIKEGDSIHFVFKKTVPPAGQETEVNRVSSLKILTIPQEYFIK